MIKLVVLAIVIVFGVIGKVGHALLFSDAAIKRKIKRYRNIRIIDIENESTAQVSGKIVVSNKSIVTPITGATCVWFKLEVFSWNTGWELVAEEREMVDFEVKDHTGNAKVIAKNIEVAVDDSKYEREKVSEDQMKSVLNFLSQKKAISAPLLVSNTRLKFREAWLPTDSEITINGKGYISNGERIIKSDLIKPLYIGILKEKS